MELRHLRYFIAVAEEASFTRAATTLHVAQSALSAQIRGLEEEVGVQLLRRSSRQVSVTPAGNALLESGREILRAAESSLSEARRIGQRGYGALSIGFVGSQSHEWMPRVLKRFRDENSNVELTLKEITPAAQLEALLMNQLDVGFIGPMSGRVPIGLQVRCIAEESPTIGVPTDHHLAGRSWIALEEVKDESYIFTSRTNSPNYRAWLNELCRKAGFRPRVVQEVDQARTGVQYVAAGFGISIFAEHLSRMPAPGVKFIPLRPAGAKIRYGVAWRRGSANEFVSRFLEHTWAEASPGQRPGSASG